MKNLLTLSLPLVASVLLLGCTTHSRRNVEYKQIVHMGRSGSVEAVLNDLAKEGWRVVSIQRFPSAEDVILLERWK